MTSEVLRGFCVQAMANKAEFIVQDLKAAGVRVVSDPRDNYTPGWKYNHWELKVTKQACLLSFA